VNNQVPTSTPIQLHLL